MSDQCWAVLGLCRGGGNDRIIRILMMRSFLWVSVGPVLGQCWANVGPMLGNLGFKLGHVGSFGGLCWAPRRFLE